MASEFEKYEQMQRSGTLPHKIYASAKSDGWDEISLIRLLRTVCKLSLEDAKKASGAMEVWAKKQEVTPGAIVYWDVSDSNGDFYFRQGRVKGVCNGQVSVDVLKEIRFPSHGLDEVPIPPGAATMTVNAKYFERTLAERVEDTLHFWNDLAHPHSKAT